MAKKTTRSKNNLKSSARNMASAKAPTSKKPANNKNNGRTSITKESLVVNASRRNTQNEKMTQVSRSVGPGTGHRGDRRDTHPSFSTGKGGRGSTAGKARDGGRSGPLGKSGRKGGPKTGDQK
ncbi:MAG TPA: hypothetical protein PK402_06975 [Tepidisphaeraceae bacterium]|nr:hypothetical protein [Tepidisphaeraceae bacterium]